MSSFRRDCPPAGYELIGPSLTGFNAVAGHFYMKLVDKSGFMGLRVAQRHLNPMGYCHGGVIATLADNQGYVAKSVASEIDSIALTVELSIDYLASAPEGAWLAMEVRLLKKTGRMLFSDALITANNEVIARTSAIYKLVK